ncbi:MAG: DeoR family transcriptional regulator [Rubrobacteraceae bacterium]
MNRLGGGGSKKIPVQWRSELLGFLRRRGASSIAEIASVLGVSGSTVRRDLRALEDVVERSYGGTVMADPTLPCSRQSRLSGGDTPRSPPSPTTFTLPRF